jgi:hypothetical protein
MTTLTANQIDRVKVAIKETKAIIANEMRYPEDLRNQERLSWYRAHLAKLDAMLLNGQQW